MIELIELARQLEAEREHSKMIGAKISAAAKNEDADLVEHLTSYMQVSIEEIKRLKKAINKKLNMNVKVKFSEICLKGM